MLKLVNESEHVLCECPAILSQNIRFPGEAMAPPKEVLALFVALVLITERI